MEKNTFTISVAKFCLPFCLNVEQFASKYAQPLEFKQVIRHYRIISGPVTLMVRRQGRNHELICMLFRYIGTILKLGTEI